MSRAVTIELPDEIGVTLRGHARKLDTASLPVNVILALFEKGVQRGANDPLGAVFDKGVAVPEADVDKYWTDLVARWNSGQIAKTRAGGVGRTTDPVQREVKRLANAEVDQNVAKLMAFHNVDSRKAFDEQFRAKYVAARIAKEGPHHARLLKEAQANLAKLAKSAGEVKETDGELADF